jgi:hypothetical protein
VIQPLINDAWPGGIDESTLASTLMARSSLIGGSRATIPALGESGRWDVTHVAQSPSLPSHNQTVIFCP